MDFKIRFKYYFKLVMSISLSAAVLIAAVYVLSHDETALRERAFEVYAEIKKPPEPQIFNINSASERALQKVSGVGEITARNIVEYRNSHGNFNSVDELLNVRGIGQSTLEKIRPYLTA